MVYLILFAIVLGVIIEGISRSKQWFQLIVSKWIIQRATGEPEIVELMVLAREDFANSSSSRAKEKITTICAQPEIALRAFQAALKSWDTQLQKIGLWGIVELRGVEKDIIATTLLDFHARNPHWRPDTSQALIELSSIVPIMEEGGFIDIFNQFMNQFMRTIYWPDNSQKTVNELKQLIMIAARRRTEFSDEDYEDVFNSAQQYANTMMRSRNFQIRHSGEDLRDSLRSTPLQVDAEKKRQNEEQRRREDTERKRQERERARHEQTQRQAQGGEQWQSQANRNDQDKHYERTTAYSNMPDYYKVLQVDIMAEPEIIESAYRRLAKKYHPDVYKATDAKQKMQSINEAYEILTNVAKRKQYDQKRNIQG